MVKTKVTTKMKNNNKARISYLGAKSEQNVKTERKINMKEWSNIKSLSIVFWRCFHTPPKGA